MICRHIVGLVAITILQACSTTSVPEATSATIVEDTAENSCRSHETLLGSGGCRVDVQSNQRTIYKWIDKEGITHYGDSVPPEFADKPEDVPNDQGVTVDQVEGKKTQEQLAAEQKARELEVNKELQRRADQGFLEHCRFDGKDDTRCDRCTALMAAQLRVTELYIRNLQRRLAFLEDETKCCMPYNSDPNAPMIEESLNQHIRDTRESIKRHQANLEKYQLVCPEIRTSDQLLIADSSGRPGSQ